ncbi:MAG: hypothetical protein ACLFR1_08530 [Spirochaetia bacterium]
MGVRRHKTNQNCPDCGGTFIQWGSMNLVLANRGACKYTYQWLKCNSCGNCAYGILEEFWEVFDDDYFFDLYRAEKNQWEHTYNRLLKCPHPDKYACKCREHAFFKHNELPGKSDSIEREQRLHGS